MLIINEKIVKTVDLSDDLVVHGNNTVLQRAAKLLVRFSIAKKQNICGITADINDEHSLRLYDQIAVRNYSGICLRKDHDAIDCDHAGMITVGETNGPFSMKVLNKAVFQNTVMLRGKTDREIDLREGEAEPVRTSSFAMAKSVRIKKRSSWVLSRI